MKCAPAVVEGWRGHCCRAHECSRFPSFAVAPAVAPKSPVADLASKLQLRLQEYINRVLMALSDVNQALHVDAFAPGCNCLVIMQQAMEVRSAVGSGRSRHRCGGAHPSSRACAG